MKRLILICAMLLGAFSTMQATHFMGANMHYDCIGADTVRLFVSTYYDCEGAAIQRNMPPLNSNPPTVPAITFRALTGQVCQGPTTIGTWTSVHFIDVTPVCPGTPTGCDFQGAQAAINGTAESIYYQDYDFTGTTCTHFEVSWTSCCRNSVITSGAKDEGILVDGLIIDLTMSPCNNSPRFLNPPIAYICAGAPARFEHQAYDPDGDSLVFRLMACKKSTSSFVTYDPGYTPFSPLGPTWDVAIDPNTGDIQLTPKPGAPVIGVLCVGVAEYRNGILISNTIRDIQFFVTTCQANNNPRINQLNVLSGANQRGFFAVDGAVGVPLSFNVQVLDPDIGDSLNSYFDTLNTNISGLTYSTVGHNPQIITANWTPPAPGRYVIRLISQDQSCPLPSTSMRALVIEVGAFAVVGNVTNTPCDSTNGAIDITVSGGTGPFTYQWSTGDSTEDLSNLAAGSYSLLVIDANGDSVNRTFFVDGSNMNLNAVVVDTSCNAGSSIQLNVSGGTAPYSYSWNTGDSSASLLGLQSSAGYSVIVTDPNGCPKNGAWWINGPDSCFNVIRGCVFDDQNRNCIQDSGEISLSNVQLGLRNAGITVLTDSNGYYSINTTYVGLDTVYVQETQYLQATCPVGGQDTVRFDSLGIITDYKFGMIADIIQDLVAIRCPAYARPGRKMCVSMFARNDGGKPIDGTLRWQYDSIFTYDSSIPAFDNHDVQNRVLEWDFTNLLPGQRFHVTVCMMVDSTVGSGHHFCDTLYVDPIATDSVPGNNTMVYCDTTRTSYDPNDKQASPSQRMTEGWILENEKMLTYTIRFQNTGGDTAFYVVLRDTLDANTLDVSTLKAVGSSHDYSLRILEDQELEVRFDNINLPYRTEIKNKAAIYFDFNAPVITNTALRTVYDEMIGSAEDTELCADGGVVALSIIQGAPPYTYYWPSGTQSNDTGISSGFVSQPGQHSIRVVDAIGHEATVDFNLTAIPEPDASFSASISTGAANVTLEGLEDNDTYSWDLGDGTTASGRTVTHSYAVEGEYTVTLVVSNACGSDTLRRTINLAVGIEDEDFASTVEIAPNPMRDFAEIRFSNASQQAISLQLFDLQGRAIRSYPATQGERFVVEKGDLQAGVYLFQLSGAGTYYGRLVVE
jgi:hypothetical protein